MSQRSLISISYRSVINREHIMLDSGAGRKAPTADPGVREELHLPTGKKEGTIFQQLCLPEEG